MEFFHGSQAQVVLEIKEGNGFTFLTSEIFAVASFRGVSLQSEEIAPASRPKFDSVFIWKVENKYLRKLRSSNTALKIDFYLNTHDQKQSKIGFVLLNLKEAKIIRKASDAKEIGEWYKLLFLKSALSAHRPEVFLVFKIEEFPSSQSGQQESQNISGPSMMLKEDDTGCQASSKNNALFTKPIQIGPPPLCTELYLLTIHFISLENVINIIPPDKLGQPLKIHFAIFGSSILTEEFTQNLELRLTGKRITFDLWSRIEFLAAYFKEFPNLVLSLLCGNDIIGTTNLDLEVLGNVNSRNNIAVNSLLTIHSGYNDENSQLGISEVSPTLQVGIDLIFKGDSISVKKDEEIQTSEKLSTRKCDAVTNTDIGKEEKINCFEENPFPFNHQSKDTYDQVDDLERENFSMKTPRLTGSSSPSHSKQPLKERTDFVLASPPLTYRMSNSAQNPLDVSKEYIRDAAIRACEELEDWKEKQQQMFELELKRKTERRLKKLSHEWLKHRKELEEELKRKIEDCQCLKEKLSEALEDLTNRCELISQREEELRITQEELDKKYTMKFQELRKASKLCEYDMEDRINIVNTENAQLIKKLEESGKEILRLQQALLNQETLFITKEEANNLKTEIEHLEQKLEKALESKAFFKEQWGKALRELHKMKEDEKQHLERQIQKNRHDLQSLGLVKEISAEVGEMKKDQFVIKNIRNELSNFFSSDPKVDPTYLLGT